MANIAGMSIKVTAQTRDFNKKMKETGRNVEKFSKKVDRSSGGLKSFAAKAGLAVVGIGAIGIAFRKVLRVIDSVVNAFNEQRLALDKIGKFGDEIDVPTESLAAFQLAAELSGTSIETVNKGLQILARRTGEAVVGVGEGQLGFKTLGLAAEELIKLPLDESLITIAKKQQLLNDQLQKGTVNYQLMSRQGQQLVNFMALIATDMDSLTESVEGMGFALSAVEIDAIERMNDALVVLQFAAKGAINQGLLKLAPAVIFIADEFTKWVLETNALHKAMDVLEKILVNTFRVAFVGIAGLVNMFVMFKEVIQGTGAFILSALLKPIQMLISLGAKLPGSTGEFFEKARVQAEAVQETFAKEKAEGVEAFFSSPLLKATKQLKAFEDKLKAGVAKVQKEIKDTAEANKKQAGGFFEPELEAARKLHDFLAKQFRTPLDVISGDATTDISFLNKNSLENNPAGIGKTLGESARAEIEKASLAVGAEEAAKAAAAEARAARLANPTDLSLMGGPNAATLKTIFKNAQEGNSDLPGTINAKIRANARALREPRSLTKELVADIADGLKSVFMFLHRGGVLRAGYDAAINSSNTGLSTSPVVTSDAPFPTNTLNDDTAILSQIRDALRELVTFEKETPRGLG